MPPRKVLHKRANSAKETPTVASKRARRQSSTKSTPLKSKHFEHGSSDGEASNFESPDEDQGSDYDEEGAEVSPPSASEEEESDYSSPPASTKKSTKKKPANNTANKQAAVDKTAGKKTHLSSKELLRHGVKTGLGPGTQVVIRKPKAREAGDTPYTNNTIHPNTFYFLADLAENNNRGWLKSELSIFLPLPPWLSSEDCRNECLAAKPYQGRLHPAKGMVARHIMSRIFPFQIPALTYPPFVTFERRLWRTAPGSNVCADVLQFSSS